MKILKKGFTNDEFSIQLEDWSMDFPNSKYQFMIGAYPKGNWKNRFRSQCEFENISDAEIVFENLLNNKTVFDFDFTVMKAGGNRVPITSVDLKRIT